MCWNENKNLNYQRNNYTKREWTIAEYKLQNQIAELVTVACICSPHAGDKGDPWIHQSHSWAVLARSRCLRDPVVKNKVDSFWGRLLACAYIHTYICVYTNTYACMLTFYTHKYIYTIYIHYSRYIHFIHIHIIYIICVYVYQNMMD